MQVSSASNSAFTNVQLSPQNQASKQPQSNAKVHEGNDRENDNDADDSKVASAQKTLFQANPSVNSNGQTVGTNINTTA